MASTTVKTRIQNKHDTSVNWAKATGFIPLAGELIYYDDLKRIKMGDGTTAVNDLEFVDDERFTEISKEIAGIQEDLSELNKDFTALGLYVDADGDVAQHDNL